MSADKYPSVFSRQMKANVYIFPKVSPIKLFSLFQTDHDFPKFCKLLVDAG